MGQYFVHLRMGPGTVHPTYQAARRDALNLFEVGEHVRITRDGVGDTVWDSANCQPAPEQDPLVSKPECQLTGEDGNAFAIIGRVSRCLKQDGQPERAAEWAEAATSAGSYDDLLQLTFEYVWPM